MNRRRWILFVWLLGLAACQPSLPEEVGQLAEVVRLTHAPDKRVAIWEAELLPEGRRQLLVRGRTSIPAAKVELFDQLQALGWQLTDSLELLPEAGLGDSSYAITALSASNIRSEPRHASELSTQTLLGMPLRLWQQQGDWYRVQTPDGYLGWMDAGGLVRMEEASWQAWKDSPRWMLTAEFALAYTEPSEQSAIVADLLAGNVLQRGEGRANGWLEAILPDGRRCWLPAGVAELLETWQASRRGQGEDLIATALNYLGRPYLWGGTSGKGMDCSGFTQVVAFRNGIQLPRDASQQIQVGQPLELDTTFANLLPGDLLFFGPREGRITHVAFHLGDGRILHASGRVKMESLRPEDADYAPERRDTWLASRRIAGGW